MILILISLTVTIVTSAQVDVLAYQTNGRDDDRVVTATTFSDGKSRCRVPDKSSIFSAERQAIHLALEYVESSGQKCVDREIWLIGSYRCDLLLDPNNSLGFYERRDYLCRQSTVLCCETCEKVKQIQSNRTSLTGQTTSRPITPERSTKPTTSSDRSAVTTTDNNCVDESFWLADGTYPCSDLLIPGTISGGYNHIHNLCESSLTRCCQTCRLVDQIETESTSKATQSVSSAPDTTRTPDTNCVDDSFWLADGTYPCSDLLTPGTISGGYNHRHRLCESSLTRCCQTCRHVAKIETGSTSQATQSVSSAPDTTQTADNNCVDESFWLADGTYPCSDLLIPPPPPPGIISGGYNHIHIMCKSRLTRCCQTCRLVAQIETESTSHSTQSVSSAPDSTHTPDNNCVDDSFWLADGTYPCSDLLTPDTISGGYNHRHILCESRLTRCCQTCRLVAQIETESTSQATQSVSSAPDTTQTAGRLQCEDSVIVTGNDWFPCSTLLDPSFTRVYWSRGQFCQQNGTVCCLTCMTVMKLIKTKPIVEGNYVMQLSVTPNGSNNGPQWLKRHKLFSTGLQ